MFCRGDPADPAGDHAYHACSLAAHAVTVTGVKDGTLVGSIDWDRDSARIAAKFRADLARLGTAAGRPSADERHTDTDARLDVQSRQSETGLPGPNAEAGQPDQPSDAQPQTADDGETVRVRHTIIEWEFESEQHDGTSWPTGGLSVRYSCSKSLVQMGLNSFDKPVYNGTNYSLYVDEMDQRHRCGGCGQWFRLKFTLNLEEPV